MKLFRNNTFYVDVLELKELPDYFQLDEDVNPMGGYVKITDKKSIEYLKGRKDILDYDEISEMTFQELEKEEKELCKEMGLCSTYCCGYPITSGKESFTVNMKKHFDELKKRYDEILFYCINKFLVDECMQTIIEEINSVGRVYHS